MAFVNLLTNGSFDTDLSSWTVLAGTWTWVSGQAYGENNPNQLLQGFSTTPFNIYYAEAEIDNPTLSTLRRTTSSTNININSIIAQWDGNIAKIIWTAVTTTEYVIIGGAQARYWDNVKVYDLGTMSDFLTPSGGVRIPNIRGGADQ